MQQHNVTDLMRLESAHFQAKLALRVGRKGDQHEKARVINRMYDTLEACQYPYLTATALIRRVGRSKALVLGLSRPLINLALKDQ